MGKKTVNINVRLDEDLNRELEEAATADDRPKASLVRRFIIAGLRPGQSNKSKEMHPSVCAQGVA